MNKGILYLLPTPLGEQYSPLLHSFYHDCLEDINIFAVERIKTARRFMVQQQKKVDKLQWFEINKHSSSEIFNEILQVLLSGKKVMLMSECGCPAIADPGYQLVHLAHKNNIKVVPLPGESSITMALMASGFQGQHFNFHGYLPIDKENLKHKIKAICKSVHNDKTTHIFIETPHRNLKLFTTLCKIVDNSLSLCLASSIHTHEEYIKTQTVAEWGKMGDISKNILRKPLTFLVGNSGF